MMTDLIKKQARNNYLELCQVVNDFKGNVIELCDILNGFNFQDDYESFDINYKSITATIYNQNNKYIVYEYIDIWDDNTCSCIKECVHITELF